MTETDSHSVEGFILAGGASRRMGRDKALLTIDGQTFIERIASQLAPVTTSVAIVGSPANAVQIPFKRVPDVYPKLGALGGVHAALAACKSEWALIVACDFPCVTQELFSFLLDRRDDHEAVAPIQKDLIPQPLCTLYRISPCVNRAEELINSGEKKPIALLQSVRTRWISFDEVAAVKGSHHFFDNINSPEDYARIQGMGDR